MTREEALAKVTALLGSKGYVFDRKGKEGKGIDWKNCVQYYVGNGATCGNGSTWEEAIDNLPKDKV